MSLVVSLTFLTSGSLTENTGRLLSCRMKKAINAVVIAGIPALTPSMLHNNSTLVTMPNDALSGICCAFHAASNSGAAEAQNAPIASRISRPQAMFIFEPAGLEAQKMVLLVSSYVNPFASTTSFAFRRMHHARTYVEPNLGHLRFS